MKKNIIYFLGFLFLCFILPIILTKRDEVGNQNEENDIIENSNSQISENINILEIDNGKYTTIKLLKHGTGEIIDVNLEEYLYNVVSAEMPADFELEALKAQAVVARTYTIYKVLNKKHDNADICTDYSCCQAWISKEDRLARWEEDEQESNWNKIVQAVNETASIIVTYENTPINAFFHSNSGGITEIPVNVWGGTGYPYLQVVETSGEDGYSQYESEVSFTNEELLNKLKETYPDLTIDFNLIDEEIQILDYTDSDRVKTVKFGNYELSGVETRTLLGLRSTNFVIEKAEGKINFSVIGYGHGVGMSQTGADAMAKQGSSYEEIINHFYKDIEIKKLNEI